MAFIGNTPISVAFLTDTFSGNGSTTAFTMTVAPANTSSILVAVTGVVQDPSTYSVSGTTLTFSGAPPSGTSNISVRYLGIPASGVTTTAYRTVTDTTATASQTSFTIPSYTVGYVDVFRNGVRLAAADFTATTGTTVVLVNACTVGDTVTTVSFYVSSVLNAIPATAGSVGTSYLVDGSVTQAKLGTGVAGNGPAFSAYASASQSITVNTATKVAINTEIFDTNSNFDSTTNYRFTPTIAGYYQINGTVRGTGTAVTAVISNLYKNGASYASGAQLAVTNPPYALQATFSEVVYLNGSTDYVELYGFVYATSGATFNYASTDITSRFSGILVRGA